MIRYSLTKGQLLTGETQTGVLSKMKTQLETEVAYQLPLGADLLPMNPLIGQQLRLEFTGRIFCQECGRKIKKTYNDGLCYPCCQTLASADMCIMKPELCHFHLGTCREPSWGLAHCMNTHYVYLANASGLKVGITRAANIPYRWMDQGATQGLQILEVKTRLQSGKLEVMFKDLIADKTNWRKMLSGVAVAEDLRALRDRLLAERQTEIEAFSNAWGDQAVTYLPNAEVVELNYPVRAYPKKITSFNLDKDPLVEGTLMGIKGQYFIFDTGVINIRKYSGYEVSLSR